MTNPAGTQIWTIDLSDAAWPTPLNDLDAGAPTELHGRGDIGALATWGNAVCVTGSRASTAYGEHVAAEFAAYLAEQGVAIITGGGYGIDGAAIRAHLAVGTTPQIVVLAGGLDRLYPAGHADLLQAVLDAGGVIVSAHPAGLAPTRARFLERNAYMATARATLVVEAAPRSGALTVVNHATSLGRPVGAVPGAITSQASRGTNTLIRDGLARLVADPSDLDSLGQ